MRTALIVASYLPHAGASVGQQLASTTASARFSGVSHAGNAKREGAIHVRGGSALGSGTNFGAGAAYAGHGGECE
jgi:hypothetical protein